MNWKEHLTYGSSVITIFTVLIIFLSFEYEFINDFVFAKSNIIIEDQYIFKTTFTMPIVIIAFVLGIYATIFPDVDIRTSKAFTITFVLMILLIFWFIFEKDIISTLCILCLMIGFFMMKHRGTMHKLYTGVIIGVILSIIFGGFFNGWIIMIYFIIGYSTHLICDRRKSD